MATIRGGKKFEAALARIAYSLSKPATLRVGFLEDSAYPNGTSVAMVAAIQNFGAPKVGIPPRPFFSNMVRDKSPRWPSAIAKNLKDTNYDEDLTLKRMGDGIRDQLQQSIRDTNSPPLAESTLARRGASGVVYDPEDPETFRAKPLIDTGYMLNSVDFEIKN